MKLFYIFPFLVVTLLTVKVAASNTGYSIGRAPPPSRYKKHYIIPHSFKSRGCQYYPFQNAYGLFAPGRLRVGTVFLDISGNKVRLTYSLNWCQMTEAHVDVVKQMTYNPIPRYFGCRRKLFRGKRRLTLVCPLKLFPDVPCCMDFFVYAHASLKCGRKKIDTYGGAPSCSRGVSLHRRRSLEQSRTRRKGTCSVITVKPSCPRQCACDRKCDCSNPLPVPPARTTPSSSPVPSMKSSSITSKPSFLIPSIPTIPILLMSNSPNPKMSSSPIASMSSSPIPSMSSSPIPSISASPAPSMFGTPTPSTTSSIIPSHSKSSKPSMPQIAIPFTSLLPSMFNSPTPPISNSPISSISATPSPSTSSIPAKSDSPIPSASSSPVFSLSGSSTPSMSSSPIPSMSSSPIPSMSISPVPSMPSSPIPSMSSSPIPSMSISPVPSMSSSPIPSMSSSPIPSMSISPVPSMSSSPIPSMSSSSVPSISNSPIPSMSSSPSPSSCVCPKCFICMGITDNGVPNCEPDITTNDADCNPCENGGDKLCEENGLPNEFKCCPPNSLCKSVVIPSRLDLNQKTLEVSFVCSRNCGQPCDNRRSNDPTLSNACTLFKQLPLNDDIDSKTDDILNVCPDLSVQ